ncbi:MAG TPA: hypothetical protein VL501_07355 [Pyrinomonadaceae bacterium]|nr:hypothetical protein [Pyrinomonadaceae bacterium]
MIYTPEMTLGEARKLYFERAGFGSDGGYDEFWIKVKIWRIPIWLPNTKDRVAAVKLHDLHHVLTEYPTTWAGEAEISAWEIGSGGLHRYWAGWWLDIMNVAQGLVVNPLGLYRAFIRGRSTRNLFATSFDDEILTHLVGEYRYKLGLEKGEPKATAADKLPFAAWVLASVATYFVSVVVPLALLGLAISSAIRYAI